MKPDERVVAEGLEAAKPFITQLVNAQQEVADQVNKEVQEYPTFPPYTDEVRELVAQLAHDELIGVYQIADKQERQAADDALKERVQEAIAAKVEAGELDESAIGQVSGAYKSVTKDVVRGRILRDGQRIDGRGVADIRQLDAEVDVIPLSLIHI